MLGLFASLSPIPSPSEPSLFALFSLLALTSAKNVSGLPGFSLPNSTVSWLFLLGDEPVWLSGGRRNAEASCVSSAMLDWDSCDRRDAMSSSIGYCLSVILLVICILLCKSADLFASP